MRTRAVAFAVTSMLVLGPQSVAAGPTRALNVEEVALVPVGEATHMEFLTRKVGGAAGPEEHTFVLLGSRETFALDVVPDGGLHVIDVTNPEQPVRAAYVKCLQGDNDIAVVPFERVIDGVAYDAFIVLSSNSSGGCPVPGRGGGVKVIGVHAVPLPGQLVSLTDFGANAVGEDGLRYPWKSQPAHTIASHPTEPLVYIASQRIGDRPPSIEILDFAAWPPVVTSVQLAPTGISPHDVTFRPDGKRAYASSVNLSFVWDTTDARHPVTIGVIEDADLKIHHEAVLHPDGRHLFVVDESVNTTSGGVGQCPGGGVHVFDLGPGHVLERAPVPVGRFYANDASTPLLDEAPQIDIGCTAHEFNFPPRGLWMPIGWTGAGTRVFDLSLVVQAATLPAPTPVVVPETGYHTPFLTDVYAAKVHPNLPGYIFASDTQLRRRPDDPVGGLRILRYTGPLPGE